MLSQNLFALILFFIGTGFLVTTHNNIAAILYSGICFLFLSFPLFLLIGKHLIHKQTKEKPNHQNLTV